MRRILASLTWDSLEWMKRSIDPPLIHPVDLEAPIAVQEQFFESNKRLLQGKSAYALRQAAIFQRMHDHCENKWIGLSNKLIYSETHDAGIMVEAPNNILTSPTADDSRNLESYFTT